MASKNGCEKLFENPLAKVLYYYGLIDDVGVAKQKIVCPFHKDVNPSMVVDLDKDSWFCFGCNASGDAFKFVKMVNSKMNDISCLREFVRILRSKETNRLHIPKYSKKVKATDKDSLNLAKDYYYGLQSIKWTKEDRDYVLNAMSYMTKRGFTKKTLEKCGCKYNYNQNYELIFPLLDNGEFKGWVCRTTDKATESKRKYLYNKGFSRSNTLAGVYGKKDYVFVVEGYMDCLKFRQFGVHNVVAILGWKMSENQISKLKSAGIKYVISALDNDDCGRKGTMFLKSRFKVVRFAYMKGIKDAGEMSKSQFDKMLSKTMKKLTLLKESIEEKEGL